MSQWLSELRDACNRESQTRVAHQVGVSPSVINQALQGKYKGDLRRLQQRVEGVFMGVTVFCPVLAETPIHECMDHQDKPFAAINPLRVRLFRICKECPNRRK